MVCFLVVALIGYGIIHLIYPFYLTRTAAPPKKQGGAAKYLCIGIPKLEIARKQSGIEVNFYMTLSARIAGCVTPLFYRVFSLQGKQQACQADL